MCLYLFAHVLGYRIMCLCTCVRDVGKFICAHVVGVWDNVSVCVCTCVRV